LKELSLTFIKRPYCNSLSLYNVTALNSLLDFTSLTMNNINATKWGAFSILSKVREIHIGNCDGSSKEADVINFVDSAIESFSKESIENVSPVKSFTFVRCHNLDSVIVHVERYCYEGSEVECDYVRTSKA